jgi:hypothetical protein
MRDTPMRPVVREGERGNNRAGVRGEEEGEGQQCERGTGSGVRGTASEVDRTR